MFYRVNTNKYGLEVVVDTTTDANFARTSGLQYVETSSSPKIGDYVHEGKFIGIDSSDYQIISEIIKVKEAERTSQEGILIPEPQPEGEINSDPSPEEQVIPELEIPSIPIGSNGEIPEDGKVYYDEDRLEEEVERLSKDLAWITELVSRAPDAIIDPDNSSLLKFDPPVTVAGIDETLSEVILLKGDTKDDYITTVTNSKEKTKLAYDEAVEKLAASMSN